MIQLPAVALLMLYWSACSLPCVQVKRGTRNRGLDIILHRNVLIEAKAKEDTNLDFAALLRGIGVLLLET